MGEAALAPRQAGADAFRFGRGLFDKGRLFHWDPDQEPNAHAIIWGASGAGKSRLLRQVIAYLARAGKHVHVLDQHGDLFVEGENTLRFGDGVSNYGLNPFDYDAARHAGPAMNVHAMVEIFRRTYLKSMRSVQELVLRQLLLDSYRCVGIEPEEYSTWKSKAKLPSMETTRDLVARLQQLGDDGANDFLEQLAEGRKSIQKMAQEREALARNPGQDAGESQRVHELDEAIATEIQQLQEALGDHLQDFAASPAATAPGQHIQVDGHPIDVSMYVRKNAARALESLSLYFDALVRHGVFSSVPPPLRRGLNRYDLSFLPDGPRQFFIEVVLAKVFRAVRMRGEYRHRTHRPRGDRVDTFVVIDEAQAILPHRSQDKESPGYILNRLVCEARKYGLGLICVTQSPSVFPKLMYSNVVLKVGLRTNQNDIPAAAQFLGVRDAALFNHIKRDGVAIVAGKESEFHSVVLDWDGMDRHQAAVACSGP